MCSREKDRTVTKKKKKSPSAHLDLVVGTPPDDVSDLSGL